LKFLRARQHNENWLFKGLRNDDEAIIEVFSRIIEAENFPFVGEFFIKRNGQAGHWRKRSKAKQSECESQCRNFFTSACIIIGSSLIKKRRRNSHPFMSFIFILNQFMSLYKETWKILDFELLPNGKLIKNSFAQSNINLTRFQIRQEDFLH
jgi:hypothetical protein